MGKVFIILYSVELYGGMDLRITTAFEHSKINIYLKFTVTNTCFFLSIIILLLIKNTYYSRAGPRIAMLV